MIVREILLLPSFEGASVIAGKTGMDNEITGAMVLEAIDIENWGKRGQLIISSFYALEHLSESETVMFFRTMSSIGIGALVFKPERLMVEAPERIIELCDDFDLPLIKLAPQVKYESILLDVLGHILDSNLTLLNRFFDVHKHLMALALKQPSIPYILSPLKNALHAEVTYFDTVRDRRTGTEQTLTEFTGYSFNRREPEAYQTHAYFDAKLFYDKGFGASHQPPTVQALAVRIPSSDGVDYYLIIHNADRELTPLDTMTVENIVSLLQMEILKQNAIKQKLFYQNNNTVHDLLLDRFGSHERIDSALALLGIDRYPLYEALLVRTRVVDPIDADRIDELLQALRRSLRASYPGIVYFVNGDRIVFLHNVRNENSGFSLDTVRNVLADLHSSSILPLFTHLAVISSATDRYSLPAINNEVMNAYRLFDETQGDFEVRYDDLGLYKLLLGVDDPSQLDTYIDPRLSALHQDAPDLFQTVVSLCANGMSYPKTAEQLYLHPKTVRYRVERVRKIYGVDVRNPDDYLQVVLADKIYTLRKDS